MRETVVKRVRRGGDDGIMRMNIICVQLFTPVVDDDTNLLSMRRLLTTAQPAPEETADGDIATVV